MAIGGIHGGGGGSCITDEGEKRLVRSERPARVAFQFGLEVIRGALRHD